MNILSFLKDNWRLLGTLILLFIIWAEHTIIVHRENTILKLNNDIEQLNIVINAKDVSIESYKKATADYDAKISSINDQLDHCNNRLLMQANDLLTIDDIMESKDSDEDTKVPEDNHVEVKKDVKQISNTTQTKGIDFINQQFDAIK